MAKQKPKQKRTLDQRFLSQHQKQKQPLGFICYEGIVKVPAEKVRMSKYNFTFPDRSLPKLECMLLYPADAKEALKDHILVRTSVKALGLTSIVKRTARPHVFTKAVGDAIAENKPAKLELVMRTGHVLRGTCQEQTKYTLAVLLGKTKVLVFKHGVYDIKILSNTECTKHAERPPVSKQKHAYLMN